MPTNYLWEIQPNPLAFVEPCLFQISQAVLYLLLFNEVHNGA